MNRSQFNEGYGAFLKHGQMSQNQSGPEANLWHSAHPILNTQMLMDNRRGSDVRSLIQNLMKTKEVKTPAPTTIYTYKSNPFRPPLIQTQQKIFQQIINLINQINSIKQDIAEQKSKTVSLQLERQHKLKKTENFGHKKANEETIPQHYHSSKYKSNEMEYQSIINKLKSHDFKKNVPRSQRSSENTRMGELLQILQVEKQKLGVLQRTLADKKREIQLANEKNADEQSNLDVEITNLRRDLDRLKQIDYSSPNTDSYFFQQIKYLNDENQALRQKTVRLLSNTSEYTDSSQIDSQIYRLQETIDEQNKNKQLFFEDLKKFKAEFQQIRRENQRLKGQNYKGQNFYKKEGYETRQRQYGNRRQNKFEQYNDLVSEMQNVLR